ncbi:MAG: hypothetical protein HZB51_31950 [Chloroflexi bacterium]|nr:hypothetical protein [Chloroflexota bacterium]
MRNEKLFTMVTPRAGFTSRVMARIAEHERAKARRRAMIGSALLIGFALIVLALIVLWLVSWIAVFVTTPQLIVSILNALGTILFWGGIAMNGVTSAAELIAKNIGIPQLFGLAMTVCALTAVWFRVVAGPSFSSHATNLGGSS